MQHITCLVAANSSDHYIYIYIAPEPHLSTTLIKNGQNAHVGIVMHTITVKVCRFSLENWSGFDCNQDACTLRQKFNLEHEEDKMCIAVPVRCYLFSLL